MLEHGDRAPDFELPDHRGERVRLTGLLADGPLVLFFYPADFTPICTAQARMTREVYAELASAGVNVAGISPDPPDKHRAFRDKLALPYRLLSDTDRTVINAYRAAGPLGFGVRRISYLIGTDGVIADALLADFLVSRHKAFIRNAIAAAREAQRP